MDFLAPQDGQRLVAVAGGEYLVLHAQE